MEAIGVAASTITILDLARKINHLRVDIKNAEKDWQRYCDRLQAVACVRITLK